MRKKLIASFSSGFIALLCACEPDAVGSDDGDDAEDAGGQPDGGDRAPDAGTEQLDAGVESPCAADADCPVGAVCIVLEDCTTACGDRAGLGAACDGAFDNTCLSHPCDVGLECAKPFPDNRCVVPGEIGAACGGQPPEDGCLEGLVCGIDAARVGDATFAGDVASCVAPSSLGAPCGVDADCASGICTTLSPQLFGFYCAPNDCIVTADCALGAVCASRLDCGTECVVPADVGDVCSRRDNQGPPCVTAEHECAKSLECVTVGFEKEGFALCFSPGGIGDTCNAFGSDPSTDGCATGLTCVDQICTST